MVRVVYFWFVVCRLVARCIVNALFWLRYRAQCLALIFLAWDTVGTVTPSSYSPRSFSNEDSWFYLRVLIVEILWVANILSSSSSRVPLDGDFYLDCW